MRIGKLHIGWREIPAWEAAQFGLPSAWRWRGFFAEFGDERQAYGVLIRKERLAP